MPIIHKLLPALEAVQHTATLQDAATQQQLTAEQYDIAALATAASGVWTQLFMFWPSKKLQSEEVASTIAPASSLALAVMRIRLPAASSHQSVTDHGGVK